MGQIVCNNQVAVALAAVCYILQVWSQINMIVTTRNTVSGGAGGLTEHALRLPRPVVTQVWQLLECELQDLAIVANHAST